MEDRTKLMARTVALFSALMFMALVSPLAAQDQVYVRRGNPKREGRAWTEHAECGGAAREGGRLVLRSDAGSVRVMPQASGRVTCRVRIRAFRRFQR